MEEFIKEVQQEYAELFETFNAKTCEELKEELQVKQDDLDHAENDILMFDELIQNLREQIQPLEEKVEKAAETVATDQYWFDKALQGLDWCWRRGGQGGTGGSSGECTTYEEAFTEANAALKRSKTRLEVLERRLDRLNQRKQTLSNARAKTRELVRRLKTEILLIKRAMQQQGCS